MNFRETGKHSVVHVLVTWKELEVDIQKLFTILTHRTETHVLVIWTSQRRVYEFVKYLRESEKIEERKTNGEKENIRETSISICSCFFLFGGIMHGAYILLPVKAWKR